MAKVKVTAGPKEPKVIKRGDKVIEKNASYKIITKTKVTPDGESGISKAKRTLYGIIHGAPKVKNAPMRNIKQVPTVEPEKTYYVKKGGTIKKKK